MTIEREISNSSSIDDLEGGGSGSNGQTSSLLRSAQSPPSSYSSDVLSIDDGYSSGKTKKRIYHYKGGGGKEPSIGIYGLLLFVITALLCYFLNSILVLVAGSCTFGGLVSLWLSRVVLRCDNGTPEMRAVSDPIREGASGFLSVQCKLCSSNKRQYATTSRTDSIFY
jgi:hypothetical protein